MVKSCCSHIPPKKYAKAFAVAAYNKKIPTYPVRLRLLKLAG
jgi:hypothetical protein